MWKVAASCAARRPLTTTGALRTLTTLQKQKQTWTSTTQQKHYLSSAPAAHQPDIAHDILDSHYQYTHKDESTTTDKSTVSSNKAPAVGNDALASNVLRPHVGADIAMQSDFSMMDTPRTSVLMELTDRVGVLHDVLRYDYETICYCLPSYANKV